MSVNQTRADKSEAQLRKPGRSGNFSHQRSFSGAGGKGSGSSTVPQIPASYAASPSSNRSFRKSSNNAQGGNSKLGPARGSIELNSAVSVADSLQNGGHTQVPVHGKSDTSILAANKSDDTPANRISRALPKAHMSKSVSGASDSSSLATPSKGDVSNAFPLQFGSLSPGFMNGMQVPARTNSAPPNLDEQKRSQARQDSIAAVPAVPKSQFSRKDLSGVNKSNTVEACPPSQVQRDAHAQLPEATTNKKSSLRSMSGTSMGMAYQQPQGLLQFGGPSAQVQPRGVTPGSLQMQMTQPVGNAAQVQAPVFVPGLQPHPLQPQGMMHQSQGLGFPPQIGHQISSQLNNLGMGMAPQYSPQQPGKFTGPRKTTVKITHPDTHEELRLDKRTDSYTESGPTGPRSHPNMPQSQAMSSFSPAPAINYYASVQPNTYPSASIFFQTPSSLPLTGTQVTPSSSASRYNFTVGQGAQSVSFINASTTANPLPVTKSGHLGQATPEHVNFDSDQISVSLPSVSVPLTIKPAVSSFAEKVSGTSTVLITAPSSKGELPKVPNKLGEPNPLVKSRETELDADCSNQQLKYVNEGSVRVASSTESRRKETIRKSDSFKDQQKKSSKREPRHLLHENQADLSENEDGLSLSFHKISRDNDRSNTMTAANRERASRNAESVESPKIAGSSSAKPFEHSCVSEDAVSSLFEPAKIEDGEAIAAVIKTSDAMVVLQNSSENSCTSKDKIDQKLVGEGCPYDPSNPFGLASGAATSECVDSAPKKDNCSNPIVEKHSDVGCEGSETLPVDSCDEERDFSEEPQKAKMEWKSNDTALSAECGSEVDRTSTYLVESAAIVSNTEISGTASSYSDTFVDKDKPNSVTIYDTSKIKSDRITAHQETAIAEAPVLASVSSEAKSSIDSASSASVQGSKERVPLEQNKPKTAAGKKKKKKELLMKADAAGTTFDLYNAFKGPEEKQPQAASASVESANRSANIDLKQVLLNDDDDEKELATGEENEFSKGELDDWEDAEISTPELKGLENGESIQGAQNKLDEYGSGAVGKKYSRDFLLTLSKQWTELPAGFKIAIDIVDALMSGQVGSAHLVDRDSYPNSGRIVDRSGGGSRVDRRGSMDDDKWSKSPGPFSSGNPRLDVHGGGVANFRPGQGGNNGVLRHPRGQPSGHHVGGILSGPALYPQGGMSRNSPDASRWQRASGVQKGLIPSPQSPLQMMHKAERKYEVGRVSDEESSKQRQLKSILNRLTPQNFDKLFEQVKAVNIDNAATLTGVISQIFDKALMEPTFCEMYANFCFHLASELPDFNEDNEKITFKRVLLNKCQEEFERGEREQAEADRVEEGDNKQSEEEREEKRIKARRRMLGNIRLIGELYKKKMLTERIMHECIKKLLGQHQNPDEEDVEALCKLMSTIGEIIDHPRAKVHMDAYFDGMAKLSTNPLLSSRVRFMLKDAIDLRKNRWQQRRKVEGPKKIEEVHRDAAQERQLQSSRLSRGPSMGPSARRGQPAMDYGLRGPSLLSSPGHQVGGRSFPIQLRGYGVQDVRIEDRGAYENRTLPVPLPQRPVNDDSITLGPQGGLGRGMSIRGQQPILSSVPLTEPSAGTVDQRRTAGGPTVLGVTADWSYGSREESMPRYASDRFIGSHAFDQSSPLEHNASLVNRDMKNSEHMFDRSRPTSPAMSQVTGSSSGIQPPVGAEFPEDKLRDMSIAAIREFYSARNEEEVCLCMKDLKSPGFFPNMVALWVVDSFDRKNDIDRDLIAKLLISLCKSQDGLLSPSLLIKGFEVVLSTLEDAITDSPKAAEYLGHIISKIIIENVLPLREVGRLIHEGGEEPGSLVKSGVAADVLFSILDRIRREKGDLILNEIRMSSNLRLEDFRPLDPAKQGS